MVRADDLFTNYQILSFGCYFFYILITDMTPEDPDDSALPDLPNPTSNNPPLSNYTHIKTLNSFPVGTRVTIRARQQLVRSMGNACFILLRQKSEVIQAFVCKSQSISKDFIKFIAGVPNQSIVDVQGKVDKLVNDIGGCTQKMEINIERYFVVDRAMRKLPFDIERREDEQHMLSFNTILNYRVVDLRSKQNQLIFQISSAICSLYRNFLESVGFIQIHTPKLNQHKELDSNSFKLKYLFGKQALLCTSPTIYHQLAILSDFQRVYEIGPIFRTVAGTSHRQLNQFTGMSFQMTINQHYQEILQVLQKLLGYIFEALHTKFEEEIKFLLNIEKIEPIKPKVVRMTFIQAAKMFNDKDMFTVTGQKQLGQLVKRKFDTDLLILHNCPKQLSASNALVCFQNPHFTNSFKIFIRGIEIGSGAQHIHEYKILQQMESSIKSNIEFFRYGCFPHGGCMIGLQRFIMSYFGLRNIRNTNLFPRDPKRISP